jgi:hypothetical protein
MNCHPGKGEHKAKRHDDAGGGWEFIDENGGGPNVRLRKGQQKKR